MLQAGHRIHALTNSPHRANPFSGTVETRPLGFDDSAQLVESLRGAAVLDNTYWVRFNAADFTHAQTVPNTRKLFAAAHLPRGKTANSKKRLQTHAQIGCPGHAVDCRFHFLIRLGNP